MVHFKQCFDYYLNHNLFITLSLKYIISANSVFELLLTCILAALTYTCIIMYASPISYFGENPQIQIRENSTCNFSSEITWISCLPCLYINFDGWYFFLFSQFFLKDRSKPCVSGHFTCNFCHGDFAQLTSSLPINCPWRGWGVQGCLFVIF